MRVDVHTAHPQSFGKLVGLIPQDIDGSDGRARRPEGAAYLPSASGHTAAPQPVRRPLTRRSADYVVPAVDLVSDVEDRSVVTGFSLKKIARCVTVRPLRATVLVVGNHR